LAVDNQASLVSLLPRPARVLLVSAGNRFLERAILATGEVELSLASNYTGSEPQFDLVVLDNITPVIWPGDNLLVFNAVHPEWFSQTSLAEGPPIVDWRKTHPLLHFVSFDDVFVAQGLVVTPPFWAVPLVDSTQAALMLAGERGAQRIVWAGFDLLQSTWPLRVSFPMFMANAVGWLNPLTAAMENVSLQPGDPLRLVIPGVREAAVRAPDGRSRPAAVNRESGEIIFAETARQGIYRLKTSDRELAFCVNLLNADESDTTPREEIQMGKYVSVGATELRRANLEIWRWIAALGLAVLLFEWWYYHRRTA
jgi:Ca-activated chloride channel homolog